MKNCLLTISILSVILFGCNDNVDLSKVGQEDQNLTKNGTSNDALNKENIGARISAFGSDPELSDPSGKIFVKTYWEETNYLSSHNTITVTVGSEYVIIGGGASIDNSYGGPALLTESRPDFANNSWVGSSKDHLVSGPHRLKVWAIGLRVAGLTAAQLRSYMQVFTNTSSVVAHPEATVSIPANYKLLGGGGRINWTGQGNLLVFSYPVGNSWLVKGKDHGVSSPASATAYAIGIQNSYIPGLDGYIETLILQNQSTTGTGTRSTNINASSYQSSGWMTSCPGARSVYSGSGRLLTVISGGYWNSYAYSKDHEWSSSGSVYSYLILFKRQ